MAAGMVISQLVNMFLLVLLIAVPVGIVVWVVANLNTNKNHRMMVQKRDDNTYIRVNLDDVEKVDILDDYEAVVHLADDQKLIIKPDDAQRMIRRLR